MDYDPSQGTAFEGYASERIHGEILDYLRNNDFLSRALREKQKLVEGAKHSLEQKLMRNPSLSEVAKRANISLAELWGIVEPTSYVHVPLEHHPNGDGRYSLGFRISSAEEIVDLQETNKPIRILQQKEAAEAIAAAMSALSEREQWVIDWYYYQGIKLKDIGSVLGVSEVMAHKIRTKAILKMREYLKKKGIV